MVVLWLSGLDVARVDQLLEVGLLHYLALLSDIGVRVRVEGDAVVDFDSFVRRVRTIAPRTKALSPVPAAVPIDLDGICAADRAQQERLFAALDRRRPQVVACEFDMVAQLNRLFGSTPDEQQLILRDVYARMDENVGKAFSFVDEETALVAIIPTRRKSADPGESPPACELFASVHVKALAAGSADPVEILRGLLN
ncbi:MAG: hypothetical protein AB7U97_07085 [Pirellulales bacterium]